MSQYIRLHFISIAKIEFDVYARTKVYITMQIVKRFRVQLNNRIFERIRFTIVKIRNSSTNNIVLICKSNF